MATYLYEQIKDYLLGLIRDNADKQNFQLPSENQLALRFQTTRITAKRALNELQKEGKIYRIHGKGSFAAAAKQETASARKRRDDFAVLCLPNLTSRFITDIVRGAQHFLRQKNVRLYVDVHESPEELEKSVSDAVLLGAVGLLVFPQNNTMYSKDLLLLALNNYPVVFIDRTLKSIDVSSVTTDHFASAKEATDLLLARGCTDIAFITPSPDLSTSIERRINGYKQSLSEHRIAVDASNECYVPDDDDADEIIRRYLAEHPEINGILSYGDKTGLSLYRVIAATGIRVPEDLKIVFLDDEYSNFADVLPFSPTCERQDGEMIGAEAARILWEQHTNPEFRHEKKVLKSELTERGSTRRAQTIETREVQQHESTN